MLSGWSFSFILKFNMADRTMVLSDGLKKRTKPKKLMFIGLMKQYTYIWFILMFLESKKQMCLICKSLVVEEIHL